MGKATRVKRENARERIAAQRAAERRRERRNRMFIAGGSILGVVVIVVAFLFFKTLNHGTAASASSSSAAGTALPASVVKDITSVPASTLTSVGAGTAGAKSVTMVSSAKTLTAGGKPEVLYIGAQYCPYCATERWAMAVALSRFGTFSGLSGIHSAGGQEVYPNTATLNFYKTRYTSKYLTFTPVGDAAVDGVQGRYFIPCVVAVTIGAAGILPVRVAMRAGTARIGFTAVSTLSLAAAALMYHLYLY